LCREAAALSAHRPGMRHATTLPLRHPGIPVGRHEDSLTMYASLAIQPPVQSQPATAAPPPAAEGQGFGADRSVVLYGNIMGQIYAKRLDQLLSIEMEIRGDPYWLGLTNIERLKELNTDADESTFGASPTRANSASPPYANYNNYDACFLLMFKSGSQPSDSDGFMHFQDSNFFNGVYLVLEVTHKFSQGKFTQKLVAQRLPTVNLNQILGSSSGSKSSTTPNTTQPPVATTAPDPVKTVSPTKTPVSADYIQHILRGGNIINRVEDR
jgi:hypothetical protein